MKARTLIAVLGKHSVSVRRATTTVCPWPTLGDVDSAEALAEYQAGKRAYKAAMRAQGKRV